MDQDLSPCREDILAVEQGIDLRTEICRGAQTANKANAKPTQNPQAVFRARPACTLGFSPGLGTGDQQLADLGLAKHTEGKAEGDVSSSFPTPWFSCPYLGVFPAVTASDDDKQQDNRWRYKSGAAWHCFGHHIYPPALISLLKSYIISLLCGDVRKIHLILLSRLRSWMNIDHWAHSDFSTAHRYRPIFKTLLMISGDRLYLMKTILETHLSRVSFIHFQIQSAKERGKVCFLFCRLKVVSALKINHFLLSKNALKCKLMDWQEPDSQQTDTRMPASACKD